MSKSSAMGLAALLGTKDPLGFALLGDIISNWSDKLETIEYQTSQDFEKANWPNAIAFFVECWGGGASGYCSVTTSNNGNTYLAGTTGGTYDRKLLLRDELTDVVDVSVGAGGAAISASSGAYNRGGDTTFGTYLKAYGGIANTTRIDINGLTFGVNDPFLRDIGISVVFRDTRTTPASSFQPASTTDITGRLQFPPSGALYWPPVNDRSGGYSGHENGYPFGVANSINTKYGGAASRYASLPTALQPPAITPLVGGVSQFGGNAGTGYYTRDKYAGTVQGESGQVPGGAGGSVGGVYVASTGLYTSGAGGSGLVKVTVIHG